MAYLFTSESVSEGHPDKVADQISDAILDALLTQDPKSRVAVETLVTTGLVVLSGEVTTNAYVDVQEIARGVIREIGYTDPRLRFDADSCGVISAIHGQSPDIAQGVDEGAGLHEEQGAGDQGMMFGYATTETAEFMPLALSLSHKLVHELAKIRKWEPHLMPYLRPDAKSQVTIEYDDDRRTVRRVHTVVLSTQHDDEVTLEKIKKDVIKHLLPRVLPQSLVDDNLILHVNPTGKFVIGGPHGDTGLTGRKIIVDTYGGKGAHGGGAFSGKDPSKVDRSAAYAARYVAKNLVAAGLGRGSARAGGLRHRRGRAGEREREHLRHRHALRRGARRTHPRRVRPAPGGHHAHARPAQAALPPHGRLRALRARRRDVHLGAARPRGEPQGPRRQVQGAGRVTRAPSGFGPPRFVRGGLFCGSGRGARPKQAKAGACGRPASRAVVDGGGRKG